MKNRVVVPLDGLSLAEAKALAAELQGQVWGFKVNDLLVRYGTEVISILKDYGKVFADPKFYDIPNTVANSCRAVELAGAELITVHCSAGERALVAAKASASSAKVLGVTVLTSFSDDECVQVYGLTSEAAVCRLAKLALSAGIGGVVCSPQELRLLRRELAIERENRNSSEVRADEFLFVVPGVRPSWYGKVDDQQRVSTPREAILNGASLLVIGRPITDHPNPSEALRLINEEIRSCDSEV